MAGIKFTHVPYKGAAPALVDVIGGQVQFMCTSPLPAMPHVKSGKLRALAMTGAKRSQSAPDIPTVAEADIKDMKRRCGTRCWRRRARRVRSFRGCTTRRSRS
jgi:tripartite-type tricarboxylate transporter receptor subunit TctC